MQSQAIDPVVIPPDADAGLACRRLYRNSAGSSLLVAKPWGDVLGFDD